VTCHKRNINQRRETSAWRGLRIEISKSPTRGYEWQIPVGASKAECITDPKTHAAMVLSQHSILLASNGRAKPEVASSGSSKGSLLVAGERDHHTAPFHTMDSGCSERSQSDNSSFFLKGSILMRTLVCVRATEEIEAKRGLNCFALLSVGISFAACSRAVGFANPCQCII